MMILEEIYTDTYFDLMDSEGNITSLRRKHTEASNKIEWFFQTDKTGLWIDFGNIKGYCKYPKCSHLKNEFYKPENLEMLYRNKKIDKILK